MNNTILHSIECDSSKEEDYEDDIGEDGGDVDNLGTLCDTLDHSKINQGPAGK